MLPRAVGLWVESFVSLRRIGNFLLSSEFECSQKLQINDVSNSNSVFDKNSEPQYCNSKSRWPNNNSNKQDENNRELSLNFNGSGGKLSPRSTMANLFISRKISIEYMKVCANWPQQSGTNNSATLDSITFKCDSPNLIAICGQLASGKSSLLMTMLNELPIRDGEARLVGTCGYSSQKAWIFNGTLRENILFGSKFQEQRYQRVIDACALRRDFQLLDSADLTYIQPDSLSGGQQARVNLARCLYRDCDIYLLDDPFSALDASVAEHIFQEAIRKFLANKLILLATNQVQMLKQCDKILVLDNLI